MQRLLLRCRRRVILTPLMDSILVNFFLFILFSQRSAATPHGGTTRVNGAGRAHVTLPTSYVLAAVKSGSAAAAPESSRLVSARPSRRCLLLLLLHSMHCSIKQTEHYKSRVKSRASNAHTVRRHPINLFPPPLLLL